MIRTQAQHNGNETPKISETLCPGKGTVYTLPTRKILRLAAKKSYERSRAFIEAQVTDAAIDIRVDWDGNVDNLGHFEVRTSPTEWKSCQLIGMDDPNDVVSPVTEVEGNVLLARFHRGPDHGHASFGVRLIPITWHSKPANRPEPDYEARRDIDYTYQGGVTPEAIPWTFSVLEDGGVQRLSLVLDIERDYEVWVRIQDPTNPDKWQHQDPIFSPSPGGGNPKP